MKKYFVFYILAISLMFCLSSIVYAFYIVSQETSDLIFTTGNLEYEITEESCNDLFVDKTGLFIVPGEGRREPISSMPGQFRLSADELVKELKSVVASGVKSVLLFGQTDGDEGKDQCGLYAAHPAGAVQRAIPVLREAYHDLIIFTDVCLCAYTSHGHCGPRDASGDVDNDAACEMLARVAVSHARAGADGVAPSAMMDGQIAAIRAALDEEGFKTFFEKHLCK